jgi:hypothetical protein
MPNRLYIKTATEDMQIRAIISGDLMITAWVGSYQLLPWVFKTTRRWNYFDLFFIEWRQVGQ